MIFDSIWFWWKSKSQGAKSAKTIALTSGTSGTSIVDPSNIDFLNAEMINRLRHGEIIEVAVNGSKVNVVYELPIFAELIEGANPAYTVEEFRIYFSMTAVERGIPDLAKAVFGSDTKLESHERYNP